MHKWNKILFFLTSVATSSTAIAQTANTATESKEDVMKAGGHIYVVLAIILTILAGLIIYIIRLDKKIGSLEKNETSVE